MKRFVLVLSFLLALVAPSFAQDPAPADTTADPRVRALLDELGYQYEVDEDGDYRAVFEFNGEKRSQVVYVNSRTNDYDGLEIREIWSPAFESKGPLAPKVANRLLEASFEASLGGWQTFKSSTGTIMAVFTVKLGADADAETLKTAMNAALSNADEMEKELSKKDVY
jgi:hypothetical protein